MDDTKTPPEQPPVAPVEPAGEPEATSRPPKPAPPAKAPARPTPSEAGGASVARASVAAIWATGRRKEAIARVQLIPGTGQILVNEMPYDRYFPREALRLSVRQPLLVTHQLGKCDVRVNVGGGGVAGQAGAVRLGIARALLQLDPALRPPLRSAGLLTRDPRMKERKKYGQKGARKRFQWTKR